MRKGLLRIVSVILALFAAMFAASCNNGDSADTGFTKGDKTKLTIWITAKNQPQYFQGYFKKAFEAKNSDIELQFVAQTNDKLSAGLDAAFSGRNAPDMASTWAGPVLSVLARTNCIVNLDDIMTPQEDNMVESALLNKVDGHHYCAPIFGFTSPTIFYNKTVFDQNGLTVPETYEELVALSQKIRGIKTSGGSQKYETMVTGYSYHFLMGLHARTCTEEELKVVANSQSGDKGVFDAEGFKNGFLWLEDMVKDGVFAQNVSGYNETQATAAFTLQKSLMIATTSLDLLELNNNAQFEIGAFLLPDAPAKYKPTYGEGKTENGEVTGVYTDSFVINNSTTDEKKAACKKVIEFFYSKEAQAELFNYFLFPARNDIGYEAVNAKIKGVFDGTLKGIYEKAKVDGMGVFYMTYAQKSGVMGNLESGAKSIMNGASGENGYESVRAFFNA